MMVQIAEQRHNKDILDDLLSKGGSSICMKPVSRYVSPGKPVDFYTLGASADRYGEVAIGYKKHSGNGSFAIKINPPKNEEATFLKEDNLIVIAKG